MPPATVMEFTGARWCNEAAGADPADASPEAVAGGLAVTPAMRPRGQTPRMPLRGALTRARRAGVQ